MYTVTIVASDGTEYVFKDVKLSRALALIRNATMFASIRSAAIVDRQLSFTVKEEKK